MKKLILIKLGGSVITDKSKPLTAKPDVIGRLAKEVKSASKKYQGKFLIAHGSGSFGHSLAAEYQTQRGIIDSNSIKGFARVADVAVKINRIVIEQFLAVGLSAVSFSPLSFILSDNQKQKKLFYQQIQQALKLRLTPVVYGDVIMDSKMGFCIYSGERILDLLAKPLSKSYKIEKIIQVGTTEGVYDSRGKTIPKITPKNYPEINKSLGKSANTDVTGGMLHKVEESLICAEKYKIPTYIINGNQKDSLKNAILGKKTAGTLISY